METLQKIDFSISMTFRLLFYFRTVFIPRDEFIMFSDLMYFRLNVQHACVAGVGKRIFEECLRVQAAVRGLQTVPYTVPFMRAIHSGHCSEWPSGQFPVGTTLSHGQHPQLRTLYGHASQTNFPTPATHTQTTLSNENALNSN